MKLTFYSWLTFKLNIDSIFERKFLMILFVSIKY